ncbi:MAG: autotransporter-associated beta strand repeat-containing protein [Paludibacter sp.]|nr:autotransporter-associated beta strand repeat-containing protein [Paludibacter sp.]
MRKNTLFVLIISILLPVGSLFAQRQMEKLNRGLVAIRTSTSSVFLSWRVLGSDPDNIAFNLYRDGVKITATPISTSSNYTDATLSGTTYTVKPVLNGVETGETNSATVWANTFFDVNLSVPSAMTMPDATTCTYSPNDCSVGDVDGDGQYEIIVKWDPSNSKDNSQSGYTGDVFLDCYKLNGTKLWRIDLGKNIRAGAHYTDFEVEDFDGDGKAEVACKTAPGTKDGLGSYLTKGPAASNTTAINTTDYRNASGYILSGPEYLTVFSGLTGAELATANYNPPRGTVADWGDSYGNRVDRFLACTAYLDGLHPSIVMCRGYYTRVVLAAWDFKNGALTQRWVYDSNSPNGANAAGQGNHNLSVADIDDDGKDEIVYGASAFDDNGKCLYATGLGHGDAMHLSDLDPDRKGLEVWEVHESTGATYGYELHDAKTGAILWGTFTGSDNGRGLAANISTATRGFEMWSASGPGISDCKGNTVSTSSPSMNFRIYWDGDLQDELLDKTSISKYGGGTLLSALDCVSNNSTKSTPCLSADIFGDWREEVIFGTTDATKLRIYSTTTPTTNKLYTLMHDAQYRDAIAWQNAGYNQPPHVGFYMGDDMDQAPVSAIYDNDKRWKTGTAWDNNVSASFTDSVSAASTFKNGDKVLFDISAGANAAVTVTGDLTPKRLKVNSPYNVVLSGTGTLNGDMDLKKIGAGSLTLNNNNNFTGSTTVWDGDFFNNGILANSDVKTYSFVKLAGSGTFGGNVTMGNNSYFAPGAVAGTPARITFQKTLKEAGVVAYTLDMIVSGGVVTANDTIVIGGDWTLSGKSTIALNVIGGILPVGNYILAKAGTVTGNLAAFKITGVPANLSYSLVNQSGNIVLKVQAPSKITWKGNVDSKWDNDKTANWLNVAQSQTFLANDSVYFNEDATLKSVVINERVIPSTLTVDATSNYALSGSGSIEGTGGITKNGTGKLTLSTVNKYIGKTIVNGGIIEVATLDDGGAASTIGAATNAPANIVLNGGKLSYTGTSVSVDRGFTLGANNGTFSIGTSATTLSTTGKLTGTGALIKEGSGRLALSASSDYTGGTIIKAGSISLLTDIANTSGLGAIDTITFQGGSLSMFDSNTTDNTSNWNLQIPTGYSGTLNTDGLSTITGSISGGGTLNYYTNYSGNILASNASKFTGFMNVTTDADGGYFALYNINGFPGARINLTGLTTMMYRITSTITIPVGDLIGASTAILGAGGTGACTITWEIGNRNANSTFNGAITNAQYTGTGAVAAIRKVGTGVWTLTNANTYTGGTTINGGTILVNNTTGSGLGTGAVTVNAGGVLAGSGIITGAVTVNDGGALSPGSGLGAFTVNNDINIAAGATLSVDINKSNSTNDLLTTTGKLTMNGKMSITNIGGPAFAAGDVFKIINGTVVGTPTEIIPAIPGDGLAWDLSDFVSGGNLKVIPATGLNETKLTHNVYPNPFKKDLRVQLGQSVDEVQISVVSVIGDIVYSNKFSNTNQVRMNLDNLVKGVYLLQVKVGDNISTQKIVKE